MPHSNDLHDRVRKWVDGDPDSSTVEEARALLAAGAREELAQRFDGRLEFGTAGLRGLLGAGPNRMNRAVVRRTTWGLCRHLEATVPNARSRGIVVGRDGRRGSDAFAHEVAGVAAALGFTVHWLPTLSPTPLTAFAVTDLGAAAGVMVTASHNPPEYNGYKVYWGNGAQIIPPHDTGIAAAIDDAPAAKAIASHSLDEADRAGLLKRVTADCERRYLDALAALDFGLPADRGLSIAYTPLHGVGADLTQRAFAEAGFTHFEVEPSQAQPDGAFPTVKFPNPEEPGALDRVLALAEKTTSDLVLAHDPDADRLAACFRDRDGSFRQLTGNEIGVLLAHHRIVDDPSPASDRLVITTIVSTPQLGALAAKLGVRYEETLTGFKWIANRAMELEAETGTEFVFGFEEALGSTSGTVVRDKDGIGAALVFATLAAQLRKQGKTVGDRLDEIARAFGVYASAQHSETMEADTMRALMDRLRASPPEQLDGVRVTTIRDLQRGVSVRSDGGTEGLTFPKSNVLVFDLESGDRVIARPSGTEPKIKFYFDVRVDAGQDEPLDVARGRAEERLRSLRMAFLAMVRGS